MKRALVVTLLAVVVLLAIGYVASSTGMIAPHDSEPEAAQHR